jgi:hypothetical protein
MIVVALTAAIALFVSARDAEAQPELILIYPEDGAVLNAPPTIIHMCFREPINILDLDKGGDFKFSVLTPDGRGLGLRIVFQPNGLGVDIHPGYPTPPLEGEWTYEWRVTEPETLEPASGTIKFTVSPDGSPIPEEPPVPCGQTPGPDDEATPTTSTPVDEDDGGNDALLIAVLAVGAIGGAVALGLLVWRLRRGK